MKKKVHASQTELIQQGVMSVDQVASYLGISYSLAYRLTQEENFPCVRIGKRRVIPKQVLDKWLEERAYKHNKEEQ